MAITDDMETFEAMLRISKMLQTHWPAIPGVIELSEDGIWQVKLATGIIDLGKTEEEVEQYLVAHKDDVDKLRVAEETKRVADALKFGPIQGIIED